MWWRHVRSDPLAHAIIWGVLRAKQPLSILFSFLSPFFLYFERACFFNRNLPNKILYIETNKGGGGGLIAFTIQAGLRDPQAHWHWQVRSKYGYPNAGPQCRDS
jgi:hypothetical protein